MILFTFFFPVGKEPKAEGERKIYLYIEGKRMTPLLESINQIKSIKQQLSKRVKTSRIPQRGASIEDTWGSVEGSILLANWSKGYSSFNLTSLCYLFTGPSERSIHLAKLEVKRVVKEEMIRLVSTYPLFSPRLFFVFLHTCPSEDRVFRAFVGPSSVCSIKPSK